MTQYTVGSPERVIIDQVEEAPIRVLHVDDETGFLKTAKQVLQMQGPFQVDTASSVEEAKEKMQEKTYDAIVCDYVMPRKDGLQFLKELRDSGNNVPFIIFTGKSREEVVIEALNLGADRYFSKIGGAATVYGELAHGIRRVVESNKTEQEIRIKDSAIASSINAVAIANLEGNLTYVNRSFLKLWGYSNNKEVLGAPTVEFWQEEEKVVEVVKAIRDRGSWAGMLTAKKKGGLPFCVYLSASMVKNEAGEPICMMASFVDITERKRAEELYKSVVELSPDSIITVDTKGVIISCNTAATRMLGYSRGEMTGKHFSKVGVLRARDLPKYVRLFSSVLKGEVSKPLELTFYRKDGTPLLAEVRVGLLKENGKTIGVQAISREIPDHKAENSSGSI